jgi:SnoaL-like polyketide cyclase
VKDTIAQGDEVVVRLVVSGTQQGPSLGIPATGKYVEWDANDIYRLTGDQISRERAAADLTAVRGHGHTQGPLDTLARKSSERVRRRRPMGRSVVLPRATRSWRTAPTGLAACGVAQRITRPRPRRLAGLAGP